MSGSFLVIVAFAVVLMVFWRATLLVTAAVMVALIVTGMGYVANGATRVPEPGSSIVTPDSEPQPSAHAEPPR